MLGYTMDDARRDHMAHMEAKMFAPGGDAASRMQGGRQDAQRWQ